MHVHTFTHQNGRGDYFQADCRFCIQGVSRALLLLPAQSGISTIFLEPSKGKQPSCLTYWCLPVSR